MKLLETTSKRKREHNRFGWEGDHPYDAAFGAVGCAKLVLHFFATGPSLKRC